VGGRPDPPPPRRVDDPELLRRLRWEWRGQCALEDETCVTWLSLHHIHKHPRDDVRPNLVMLCGDGVAGHHGRIEHADRAARAALAGHILSERPDTVGYLIEKLRGAEQAMEWLRRYLHAAV